MLFLEEPKFYFLMFLYMGIDNNSNMTVQESL